MPFRSLSCWPNIGRSRWQICGLLLLVSAGCTDSAQQTSTVPTESTRLTVAVTSAPLFDMATAVAGDLADVSLVVPTGEVSRKWQPTPDAVAELQAADLILISGAGYEPWRQQVSLPMSRVIDTAEGYYTEFIRIPDAVVHQHGPDGAHSHPGTVWATWLDPQLAIAQLDRIESSLAARDPAHAEDFRRNSLGFRSHLTRVDQQLTTLAADSADLTWQFLADGPYYQYLVRRLNRPLKYLHWPQEDVPLTETQREGFRTAVAEAPRTFFLLRMDCPSAQRELVASDDVVSVAIDLIEQIDETPGGFPERLQANFARLEAAIRAIRDQSSVPRPAAGDSAGTSAAVAADADRNNG